ncbi:MAG: hypothetical protein AAFN11_06790 [Chloroflexota bacterium]
MTEYKQDDKIPVPRKRVFVLADGRFVIQWEENRVQDLLNGRYTPFNEAQFGAAITDYELNQLVQSNVVDSYDAHLVYLAPDMSASNTVSGRTYYLNTTLSRSQEATVSQALKDAELDKTYSVRVQSIFVIIRGPNGTAFRDFDAAERARENLLEVVPDIFEDTVVAFVEVNPTP